MGLVRSAGRGADVGGEAGVGVLAVGEAEVRGVRYLILSNSSFFGIRGAILAD